MDVPVKRKRRARTMRHPTGKRVTPGAYEPVWFQKLWQHGPLTTKYLYEFSKDLVPSESTANHRLGDLFHENNTPQGDAYLLRPEDQNRQTKRLHEIYENDRAAEEYLKAHGLIPHLPSPTKKTNFPHQFMAACITSSIELASRDSGITFVSAQELLQKSPSGTFKMPATFSYKGKHYTIPIVPDAYFGLRYGDRGVRAFVVEADRGTEPIERSDMENQRSYLRKILQYQALLTQPNRTTPAPYHELLGIQCGLLVLNVTTSFAHMESMIAKDLEATDGRGSAFRLYKTLPLFADKYAVPKSVLSELFTTPWRRAAFPDIDISKA